MRNVLAVLSILLLAARAPALGQAPSTSLRTSRTGLVVHVIDVEGGQATLFVSPSGESMLVDAGWPGFNGRDADRIVAAAKQAGVSQIDYLVTTHYHTDHVGGVPQLAAKIPIRTFVDHGPTVEKGTNPDALFAAYVEARGNGQHLEVKPGDAIPIKGLDVKVVSAGGALLKTALPGGGAANPLCAAFKSREDDPTENARSVGTVITFGRFRMLDLGDLTWNNEGALVCPNNVLGTIDVYLTTHHGADTSGPPVLVHAIRPRVAVMNNGSKKGGTPPAWQIVRDTPGLEDFWQVHRSEAGGATHNTSEPFIANMDDTTGHGITITAQRDGSFAVTNARNGHAKRYAARIKEVGGRR